MLTSISCPIGGRSLTPHDATPLTIPTNHMMCDDLLLSRTVVYELLTKRFPFTTDHLGIPLDVASVIFMVGCGSRQDIKCAVPKKLKVGDWGWMRESRWVMERRWGREEGMGEGEEDG